MVSAEVASQRTDIEVERISRLTSHVTLDPKIGSHAFGGEPAVGKQELVVTVLRIHPPREHQLAMMVHARNALRLRLGPAESRLEHRRQNGNNCDHHEQFN